MKAAADVSTEQIPRETAERPAFQFFDQRETFMPTVELWESTKKRLAALEVDLASETAWAKEYHDNWQAALQKITRLQMCIVKLAANRDDESAAEAVAELGEQP